MNRKGREATCAALAVQGAAPRFPQRLASSAGEGMTPCPESEARAVLLSLRRFARKRSAQVPGIVTRKGGNRKGSVRVANRARKGTLTDTIICRARNALSTDWRYELFQLGNGIDAIPMTSVPVPGDWIRESYERCAHEIERVTYGELGYSFHYGRGASITGYEFVNGRLICIARATPGTTFWHQVRYSKKRPEIYLIEKGTGGAQLDFFNAQ